jgi:uncharacterized protein YodC (DUF2158 family)
MDNTPLYRPGDVVQLKSGGAPFTVSAIRSSFWRITYEISAMSPGGLVQQVTVDREALQPYTGRRTAPCRAAIPWDI